jgi:hypothetical protein
MEFTNQVCLIGLCIVRKEDGLSIFFVFKITAVLPRCYFADLNLRNCVGRRCHNHMCRKESCFDELKHWGELYFFGTSWNVALTFHACDERY